MDTAITRPRALNEPVGRRPSSLTSRAPPSVRPARSDNVGNWTMGVAHSPSVTQSSSLRTGSISRHFQSVGGREAKISRVSFPLSFSKS